jgi:hypothetical protein
MQPEKSQLDTIELFLRKLVSKEKALSLVKQFASRDEELADQTIKLFETRSMVRIQDIERLLE